MSPGSTGPPATTNTSPTATSPMTTSPTADTNGDPGAPHAVPLPDRLGDAVHSDGAPSARNLLVTVFGDAILLAGPQTEVSVGTLHGLLADFEVNERLVRTSLSRLVADGLVESRSIGRRSLYRIAPPAVPTFDDASDRIYRTRTMPWDGEWTIVVVDAGVGEAGDRQHLRASLGAIGFASAAPNVLVSPLHPPSVVGAVGRTAGSARVLVTRSPLHTGDGLVDDRALAAASLGLDDLAERYCAFASDLDGTDTAAVAALSPADAWKLRVLTVASFRRIALIDPGAPPELLPVEWPGRAARELAASIYRDVAAASDVHVRAVAGLELRTPPDRFEVPDSRS